MTKCKQTLADKYKASVVISSLPRRLSPILLNLFQSKSYSKAELKTDLQKVSVHACARVCVHMCEVQFWVQPE